ncbi:hypothetical protein B566_EDAN002678 [Ephemera danica]|nr:hypothetical protein B566_EDAN002678 [Ephemera danica]
MDSMSNVTSFEIFYPRSATIFASVSAVLFTIIGVAGNLVTVLALLRCSKLRQHATTAFVVSLCVSDLMFCSINLPLIAARYIYEEWIFGDTMCMLFPFFLYGNVAVSLLSMVAITINRYILIACHSLYDRLYTKRYIFLMILFAWLFSFSMMIPPLVGAWGQLGLDPPTFSCTILRKDGASPKKFFFIFGFLLPCLVIIVSYSCIYWKAGNGCVTSPQQQLQRREDIRLTRMMLTIFCCFLVCFCPLMVVNVAHDSIQQPIIHVLASILAWASSVINPIIYAFSNRQYRQAYRTLICGRPTQQRTSATQSRSGSGKTFITEMLQFNAATEKVKITKNNCNA